MSLSNNVPLVPYLRGVRERTLLLQSAILVKHELLVGGDYGVIPSQRRTSRRPCERAKRSVLQRGLSMVKSEGDDEGQAGFTVDIFGRKRENKKRVGVWKCTKKMILKTNGRS